MIEDNIDRLKKSYEMKYKAHKQNIKQAESITGGGRIVNELEWMETKYKMKNARLNIRYCKE